MKTLQFVGIDDWDRPVYKDECGQLWKDINLGSGTPSFHSANNNEFDGEPNMPLREEYKIAERKARNRYRVYGHTTVTVVVEVTAESEEDAREEALNQLCNLEAYVGNGGMDKLIGVSGDDESVSADEEIEYDDIELLGPADEDEEEYDEEDEDE